MVVQTGHTGYGGRLGVSYEYGLFHFQRDGGEWMRLGEVAQCGEI